MTLISRDREFRVNIVYSQEKMNNRINFRHFLVIFLEVHMGSCYNLETPKLKICPNRILKLYGNL